MFAFEIIEQTGASVICLNQLSASGIFTFFSPIATALIGYKINDEIEWIVPAGLTKLRIDEIIYQPEAAGDFDL